MQRLSKKGKLSIMTIVVIVIIVGAMLVRKKDPIVFIDESPIIEVHSNFDAANNIDSVKNGEKDDVTIDLNNFNKDQTGTYDIIYKIRDKSITLTIEVVDTKAPDFTVLEGSIDLGMKLDPNILVKDIVDDSKTKVYIEEDIAFDQEKDYEITVVVEDEFGNKRKKTTILHVLPKDTQAPTLNGVRDLRVKAGANIDLLSGISAKDNQDPNPTISVNTDQLNLNRPGKYSIIYQAVDRSGNKEVKKAIIEVVENVEIGTSEQSNEKIVYLTFDDGPSEVTPKILKVLDQYHVKATFFVTGAYPKYANYIKIAHDKGHTIGMHTYGHNYTYLYSSVAAYYEDLNKIANLCEKQLGYEPKYIRFPGGGSNMISKKYSKGIMSKLTKDVVDRGYQYYDWNADSGDASGTLSAKKIVKNATQYLDQNNIVLLCHDGYKKESTIEALPKIIEFYQSHGYTFKAIDDSSFVPHHHINN